MQGRIGFAVWLNALMGIGVAGAGCTSGEVDQPHPALDAGSGGQGMSMNAGGSSGNSGNNAGGGSTSSGNTGTSGRTGSGGSIGTGGSAGNSGGSTGSGGATGSECDTPGLLWKTGSKTNYTSYPDPGSVECIQYSGCLYEGQFAACSDTKPKNWVMDHNIVAAFPDFKTLKLHDLCLKSGTNTIVVTVLDTCGDSDCNGCCTQNQGSADELIDVESFTDARWGVEDGPIQWADLGPTKGAGCQ